VIATILQVLGLAAVAVGVAFVVPWLGLVVAGVELVALGVALEMRSRDARSTV
jgi:uncharacterized membrane protein